jgi:hypothetical protein
VEVKVLCPHAEQQRRRARLTSLVAPLDEAGVRIGVAQVDAH